MTPCINSYYFITEHASTVLKVLSVIWPWSFGSFFIACTGEREHSKRDLRKDRFIAITTSGDQLFISFVSEIYS